MNETMYSTIGKELNRKAGFISQKANYDKKKIKKNLYETTWDLFSFIISKELYWNNIETFRMKYVWF